MAGSFASNCRNCKRSALKTMVKHLTGNLQVRRAPVCRPAELINCTDVTSKRGDELARARGPQPDRAVEGARGEPLRAIERRTHTHKHMQQTHTHSHTRGAREEKRKGRED
eukprot:6179208-Pleurochrysis_carterae.AAC.1